MIEPKAYALALYQAISETAQKDHDRVLENFARILNQNGDLQLYDQIEQEYERLEKEAKGIKQAEVTTARDINQKQLIESLNSVVGGKVELKHKIDENLIGGVVVRIDDTLIDGSLKNSLEKLRRTIAG